MIIIGDKLISEDLFNEKFCCDITACVGTCCVEGDSGAPLDYTEVEILEKHFNAAKEYLSPDNIAAVENQGFAVRDYDNELVTPLLNRAECAYSYKENGITLCAYERAYLDGKIPWRKPISCHLYPIRLNKVGIYTGIKLHRWNVCHSAFILGRKKNLPAYKFLEEPLVRRFGQDFYDRLCEVAEAYLKAHRGK